MFNLEDAARAVTDIGIEISDELFDLDDVLRGMDVEMEHGTRYPDLNVTGDDPVLTAKIALAHLREFPDYYERLEGMEHKAEAAWSLKEDAGFGIT
ncbi:MAG TPA: DUF5661 family protein [Acidimicrobiia bacterium]|nr:DUF5661 family protein [Acidimicrobiia bacterium]